MRNTQNLKTLIRITPVMAPQTRAIATHLSKTGNISGVEAAAMFKTRHLPARIKELRDAGVVIISSTKYDTTGQRYVRYVLEA